MKKSFLLLAVLLTLTAVLAAPVSAQDAEAYYYWGTGGIAVVTPPGHPTLMIEALNIKRSTPFPPHDMLMISVWMEIDNLTGFYPWLFVTDDAECADLVEKMLAGTPYFTVVLVGERELQVWSRVKAVLSVPVEAETPEGNLTIHPFEMLVRGRGRGEWTEEEETLPTGYTLNVRMKVQVAAATITAPDGWECPAEEAYVSHPLEMTVTATD